MDTPVGSVLKEWQSYVTVISRNLMELSEQNDVKIIKLKARDSANGYTGLTKAKAVQAVDDLNALWRYYALLSGVVDKAAGLYSKDSFLRDTEPEVKELLENTPVTLETEHIDISSRKLLESENKEKKVSLRELLRLMQESFEATLNSFNQISHAAETVQNRIECIKNESIQLNNTALHLGLANIPSFEVDKADIIASDPLQGLAELDALYLSLEKYRSLVKSAQEDYNQVNSMLESAEGMLREIEDLSKKSEDAVQKSLKIFGTATSVLPVADERTMLSLWDWLHVLQGKLSEGSVSAAKIGAQRLENECTLKLNGARENYCSNCRDYNEWIDLKGEFKALLAKLAGLKARGIKFDSYVDALADEIQSSLNGDCVNLIGCRELIERFYSNLKI